jgi:hypothetical protein
MTVVKSPSLIAKRRVDLRILLLFNLVVNVLIFFINGPMFYEVVLLNFLHELAG